MLYVDEVYAYATGTYVPEGLFACITRGRSRGVGGIFATQRPALIPLVILSESDVAYVFRLRLDQDRKRIRDTFGVSEGAQLALRKYEFYVAAAGDVRGPYTLRL